MEVIRTLKDIMIEEENESFTLIKQAGDARLPAVGWYVGYVVTQMTLVFRNESVTRDNRI